MYNKQLKTIKSINKQFTNEEDFEKLHKLYKWILMPIGLWPLEKSSFIKRHINKSLMGICNFLMLFLVIPNTLCILLEIKNPMVKLKMFAALSFVWMSMSQYAFLSRRSSDIYRCIRQVESNWSSIRNEKEKESMYKYFSKGFVLSRTSAFFMYLAGFFYYTIMPFSSGKIALNTSGRDFVFSTYTKMFDPADLLTFQIVYAIQWIAGYVTYTVTIGSCALSALLITNTSAQLDIIKLSIEDFFNEFNIASGANKKKLSRIFARHCQTLGFAAKINGIFNYVSFIEVCGCTLHMCFVGYFFLTEIERSEPISTFTYCALVCAFTSHIYLFCSIGENYESQCRKVGRTFYMTDWYILPSKYALCGVILIRISDSPAKMTAVLFDLSLSCFADVIRSSLMYLNFLRATM